MRWMFASMTATLLGAWLLYPVAPDPNERDPDCSAAWAAAELCSDQYRDHHAEPLGIEDEVFKSTMTRKAIALLEQGQTVDMPSLIRQLKSGSCSLDLHAPELGIYDPVELYPTASRSVVAIGGIYKCNRCSRWHMSTASGFVIAASGAIVTNYHVVDDPENQTLVVMTADREVYPVKQVLAASRADDLAILRIEASGLTPLPLLGRLADAPVGSAVSVISHPDGRFFFYSAGVISRHLKLRSAGSTIDALTISAEYARGSSGAPVLNQQGQVVAVVSSTESIYYTQDAGRQRDLQMVFRNCIPAASILQLIRTDPEMTGAGLTTLPSG
ncbi:MAG: S1C family serine protease [Pirellulaceae bacterium]|nr:S1C family serine protease [Pirellulaceae bacterium]